MPPNFHNPPTTFGCVNFNSSVPFQFNLAQYKARCIFPHSHTHRENKEKLWVSICYPVAIKGSSHFETPAEI